MARVAINTGATANDGTGDTLRAAGGIINDNFLEVYTYLGAGSTTTLSAPIWNVTGVGINTLRNVGIGTTNPRFNLEVGAVGASGTSLWVNGNARITGILTIGTASITLDGSSNLIKVGSGLTINGASNTINFGSGVTIDGSAGIITAAGIYINGSQSGISTQWITNQVGIHTFSNVGIGTTNPTSALTVSGLTSTTSLSVTGVSTFSDSLTVESGTINFNGTDNINAITRPALFDSVTINSASPGIGAVIDNTGFYRSRVDDISGSRTSAMIIGRTQNADSFVIYNNGDAQTVGSIGIGSNFSVTGVSTLGGARIDEFGNITLPDRSGSAGLFTLGTTYPTYISEQVIERTAGGGPFYIRAKTGENSIVANQDGSVELYYDAIKKFETVGAGITITGTTFTNQLSVSGVTTCTGDVNVGVSTSQGLILTSSNGTKYRLIVANDGTLSTTAI